MTTPAVCNRPFFAAGWKLLSSRETAWLRDRRRDNLAGLSGRVLEVGSGAGTNFALYPDTVTQVVALEPEPRLAEASREAAAAAAVPVEVINSSVEAYPDDEEFDAAVCSMVLCSVDDPAAVLGQLRSRLRPGGELRYFEHVASDGMHGRLQRAVDATFWPHLFGNCHTHRDTETLIDSAGFTRLDHRRGHQFPAWLPIPVSEFAMGRAVRDR